jgi:NAD(P)-dependent dehydrogenase (short-subunit alcohol dehydrogenase family)
MSLKGKVAAVVGGTSGIGRAIAIALAEAGADVVAASRRTDQVESVAQEIETLGRRTLRATCDVADRASLEKLLATSKLEKVDILVNSAGRTKRRADAGFLRGGLERDYGHTPVRSARADFQPPHD